MSKPNATPIRVIEETPGYWRALFDYPPFNVVDGDLFQALQGLLVRMETSKTLRVVVFESALPDFYLSHFDLTGKLGNVMTGIGPSGLPVLMDTFVRLTKAPVVSLAKIRGCVRGVSSEFVLACDMRFASRENLSWVTPSSASACIQEAAEQNAFPIWSGAGGHSKSSSVPTTLMETRQNDMAM